MIEQLKMMLEEEEFVGMIEAIYLVQEARILVNSELMGKIDIKKGTRQGCPLSPLLFIFTMEVLNNNIRA